MKLLGKLDGSKNVIQNPNNKFVTDSEKAKWNAKADQKDLDTVKQKLDKIDFSETIVIGLPIFDSSNRPILDSGGIDIEGERIYKLV